MAAGFDCQQRVHNEFGDVKSCAKLVEATNEEVKCYQGTKCTGEIDQGNGVVVDALRQFCDDTVELSANRLDCGDIKTLCNGASAASASAVLVAAAAALLMLQ